MPSRQPPPPQPAPPPKPPNNGIIQHQHHHVLPFAAVSLSFFMCLTVLYRKLLPRKRTAPSDSNPPHRFSYSVLRRATSSFSASNRLGQGGFGSVYRGTLSSGQEIAVKVMDSGSLQGEREFQNEVSLGGGKIDSEHIVSLIGFSSDRKKRGRRMILVYELMQNGSLQDALIHRKCPELMEWKKRVAIAIDIAKGLEFLHSSCNPPIIHGDVKPSNILLDSHFNAKIADFGLARLKCENPCVVEVEAREVVQIDGHRRETRNDDFNKEEKKEGLEINGGSVIGRDQSLKSFMRVMDAEESLKTVVVDGSPPSESNFNETKKKGFVGGVKRSLSEKNWWWRQDNGGSSESGSVKDYVMEWIGAEIKAKPKSDWKSESEDDGGLGRNLKGKKQQRSLDWWMANDEDHEPFSKKDKTRPMRKWWREEFCEELTKKTSKKKKKRRSKSSSGSTGRDRWWLSDEDSVPDRKKKNRSRNSWSSIDWWLDGLNGELWTGRRNSHDGASETPKSSNVSSTTSMRGTVCYVAPEYGAGDLVSEKCDVYSYGVLLLVLVSGRRPLQVTASPLCELERANLISWARHLARREKLPDLVDPGIQCLDRDQAVLCITVALLCLQKLPAKRPTMKEVVAMLSGESEEPPHLPLDLSPPPFRFPFKSRKKAQ